MRTDQLTNKEIYRLVSEAYAAYYLSGDYLKTMARRYLNPLGKFNWMGRNVPRYVKTVIRSGYRMLHSQGITGAVISEELKSMKNQKIDQTPTFEIKSTYDKSLYEKQVSELAN